MENYSLIPNIIQWTRKCVVTLSIIIIVTSLSQYSKEAVPVTALLPSNKNEIIGNNNNEDLINRIQSFGQALIQDRRLIATLVAAQTSIFCPLFLLVGNAASCINHHHINANHQEQHSSFVVGFWKTTLDLVSQIIMPLGLALNWIFCLSFDNKSRHLIHTYFPDLSNPVATSASTSSIWSFAWNLRCNESINLLEGLKFLTIMILGLETIFVCITWVQHCLASIHHNNSKHSKSIELV